MKKKYLLLAVLLALTVITAGCGRKSTQTGNASDAQEVVTPAGDTQASEDIVQMQTATEENAEEEKIENEMGTKTATASKIIMINKTGDSIAQINIRPNSDDDEWGEDLVKNRFVMKDGDKAVYYLEKNQKDDSGKAVSAYDICITYQDMDKSQCFFRKLPLAKISQITLRMDGKDENAIPYATYCIGSSKKEYSTLQEVRQRLGLLDEEEELEEIDEPDDDTDDELQQTEAPTVTPAPQISDDNNDTGSQDNNAGNAHDDLTNQPGDPSSIAAGYIGQSLDQLINACGEPSGSDWVVEPESGETGYHYYDSFTVSTVIDENGNEIVAGVW